MGDVGLVAYELEEPALSPATILHFYTQTLPIVVGRLPAPNSIIVLDNMTCHRSSEAALRAALYVFSLFLFWFSPLLTDPKANQVS